MINLIVLIIHCYFQCAWMTMSNILISSDLKRMKIQMIGFKKIFVS